MKEIDKLKNTIEHMQNELERREQYWRDWNGRAANHCARLEAENKLAYDEIDRLKKYCVQCGEKMQKMKEWMQGFEGCDLYHGHNIWENMMDVFPESARWFDKDGSVK